MRVMIDAIKALASVRSLLRETNGLGYERVFGIGKIVKA